MCRYEQVIKNYIMTGRKENKYMWLLKLHFAFSILCMMTFFGVMMFSQDVLKRNGYVDKIEGKKNIRYYLRCIRSFISLILLMFIPILNISGVIIIFQMIRMSKDEFMDWQQDKFEEFRSRKKD